MSAYRLTRRAQVAKAFVTTALLTTITAAFVGVVTVVLFLYLTSTGAPR